MTPLTASRPTSAPTVAQRSSTPDPRRRAWRRRSAGILTALALVVSTVVFWLAVGDDANEEDLARALASHDITISDNDGVLTIMPAGGERPGAVGVAFLPGTRIERHAYVATWAPIVEETGVIVHVAAVPLNLPALADDPIGEIIRSHPETSTWIVGGHSMGGFEAAAFAAAADAAPAGLLLWGSGPARSDLADAELPILVVSGALDTVLPLERVIDEERLTPATTIEIIDGMVHGQFGRYSDTASSLDPSRRSDADTLADLADVTVAFVAQVAAAAANGASDATATT